MYEVEVFLNRRHDKVDFMATFSENFPRPAEIEYRPKKTNLSSVPRRFLIRVTEEMKWDVSQFLERYAAAHNGQIRQLPMGFMFLRAWVK